MAVFNIREKYTNIISSLKINCKINTSYSHFIAWELNIKQTVELNLTSFGDQHILRYTHTSRPFLFTIRCCRYFAITFHHQSSKSQPGQKIVLCKIHSQIGKIKSLFCHKYVHYD